jgi:hypothetical protein
MELDSPTVYLEDIVEPILFDRQFPNLQSLYLRGSAWPSYEFPSWKGSVSTVTIDWTEEQQENWTAHLPPTLTYLNLPSIYVNESVGLTHLKHLKKLIVTRDISGHRPFKLPGQLESFHLPKASSFFLGMELPFEYQDSLKEISIETSTDLKFVGSMLPPSVQTLIWKGPARKSSSFEFLPLNLLKLSLSCTSVPGELAILLPQTLTELIVESDSDWSLLGLPPFLKKLVVSCSYFHSSQPNGIMSMEFGELPRGLTFLRLESTGFGKGMPTGAQARSLPDSLVELHLLSCLVNEQFLDNLPPSLVLKAFTAKMACLPARKAFRMLPDSTSKLKSPHFLSGLIKEQYFPFVDRLSLGTLALDRFDASEVRYLPPGLKKLSLIGIASSAGSLQNSFRYLPSTFLTDLEIECTNNPVKFTSFEGLPSTLRRFRVRADFKESVELFASLPRELLHLYLLSYGQDLTINRRIIGALPSGLQSLIMTATGLSNHDIISLPRGLTVLSIPSAGNSLTDNCIMDFPPGLTQLHVSTEAWTKTGIKKLPSSITDIRLGRRSKISSENALLFIQDIEPLATSTKMTKDAKDGRNYRLVVPSSSDPPRSHVHSTKEHRFKRRVRKGGFADT